jgi:hypothetical protein
VVDLPPWKIWVRQWEGWQPIYEMENEKYLKPPTSFWFVDGCFDLDFATKHLRFQLTDWVTESWSRMQPCQSAQPWNLYLPMSIRGLWWNQLHPPCHELGKIITKSLTVEGEAYRSPIHDSRSKLGHFCSSWLSRSVQGENVIEELTLVLQELETEVWRQVPATLDFLGEPWVFHVVRLPYGFSRPLRPFGFRAPPVVALQTLLATRAGHRSGRRRTWRLWRARGGEDIASKDATKIAII